MRILVSATLLLLGCTSYVYAQYPCPPPEPPPARCKCNTNPDGTVWQACKGKRKGSQIKITIFFYAHFVVKVVEFIFQVTEGLDNGEL